MEKMPIMARSTCSSFIHACNVDPVSRRGNPDMNPVKTTMSIFALKIARHKTHIRCLRSWQTDGPSDNCQPEKHLPTMDATPLCRRNRNVPAGDALALPRAKAGAGESLTARVPVPRGV